MVIITLLSFLVEEDSLGTAEDDRTNNVCHYQPIGLHCPKSSLVGSDYQFQLCFILHLKSKIIIVQTTVYGCLLIRSEN